MGKKSRQILLLKCQLDALSNLRSNFGNVERASPFPVCYL